MVEKIIIKPGKVRGLGNIISPAKTTSDFSTYKSSLVLSSGVYTLAYAEEYSVALSLSSSTIYVDGNTTLTATVTYQGSAVTEGTVTFYDGTTSLGTGSLGSGGTATYTASGFTAGTHQLTAVFSSSSSPAVTLTVNKRTPTISLSASSTTVTYGDIISLTPSLTNISASHPPIKLYINDWYIGYALESGDAYPIASPGVYSCKAVYEGNESYEAVTSSTVIVTINKQPVTLTINVPATGTVETAYNITGTSSVTGTDYVHLYEDGAFLTDILVENGVFSKSITKSSAGTHTYYVTREADTFHESATSSSGSIVVSSVVPASMTLEKTAGKQILSYADKTTGSGNTEYCTLTATVLDSSSNPLSGQSVVFKVGSTTVDTVTTDSNGQALYSYVSAGSGDVTITAECSLVTESFAIEDCTYYHESAFTSTQSDFNVALPSAFEISFTVKRTHNNQDYSYLDIGGNTANTALMGQVGSSGESEVRIYDSEGSSGYSRHLTSNNTINTDTLYKWVHNGTDNSFSMNSDTITWTDSKTHSKIRKLNILNNKLQGLKIKPL